MDNAWRADRHRLGWAVYRAGGETTAVYKLPNGKKPLTFPDRQAAAVWAAILNERANDEAA